MYKKPPLEIQTTTLWDYPSQHYGDSMQGDRAYKGATPSYVIWNLLQRYTKEGDIVVDPMCGSGTTIDVCRDLKRTPKGFDIAPFRKDIAQADARRLPLRAKSVDFVFVDPPYSTHLKYSGHPQCIGELDAGGPEYYKAMERVIKEMHRILKDGCYLGLYVSDSYRKDLPFEPIGFDLFQRMRGLFTPIDIIAVVRHNKSLKHPHWRRSAKEGNYYMRGFNYLFIMKKEAAAQEPSSPKKDRSQD
jgi:adenine-specific DNA-methyltransferase